MAGIMYLKCHTLRIEDEKSPNRVPHFVSNFPSQHQQNLVGKHKKQGVGKERNNSAVIEDLVSRIRASPPPERASKGAIKSHAGHKLGDNGAAENI